MKHLHRIAEAQKLLTEKNVDALWIADPTNIFYLTGLSFSSAKLVLQREKAHLFVDGRYIEIAKKKSPCPVSLHTDENIKTCFPNDARIGFDGSLLPYDGWMSLKKLLEKWEKEEGVLLPLCPVNAPLKTLRLIKDKEEIASLKKAANLNKQAYLHILSLLKEGIEERELAYEYTVFCLKHGALKLSFDPIIAFGVNSSYPHHRTSSAKLQKNDIVLMDLGVTVESYCSDMTRVHFHGSPNPELVRIQKVVKEAHKKALSHSKAGIPLGKLDEAARAEMAKENLEPYFLHKQDGEDKNLLLQPGMVITIEPGLYLPDLGGVRHEDTILITENGYENFYAGLP
jgi:Xaa-Pro aminopeptidase